MNEFIVILKDFLNNKKSNILVTPELVDIAKKHQLEGVLYYQTKEPSLIQYYYTSIFHSVKQKEMQKELLSLLTEAFLVKGSQIADYYPIPELRVSGDIDVTVPKSLKEESANILENAGYIPHSNREDMEWHFSKNGIEVELHHDLLYDEVVNDKKYQEYFSHCWDYVENGRLEWNFHYLYILIHFRKHFMNKGVGFRSFMDLAVLSKNEKIDWKYIKSELEKLDLLPFAQICYSLIEKWFEIKSPVGSVEMTEEFIEYASELILKNGVFGFDNEDNNAAAISNEFIQSKHSVGITKMLLIWGSIFPSYTNMRYVPYYNFLNNKPYLLPIAWIYRWVTKWTNGNDKMDSIFRNDHNMIKRERYLKEWGLK